MKKNSLAIFSCILLSVFLLTACGETNPNPSELPSSSAEPTPVVQADGIQQQPHSEASFEDMITFLNTVDANTFENGNFKNIIEQVKAEGYIVRPYFDGQPSTLYETVNGTLVVLCPEYENAYFPPEFLYHLIDDNYRYRVEILYIEEEMIPIAEKWGYIGINRYKRGDTEEEWTKTTSLVFNKQMITFGDIETEVTIVTDRQDENSSYASFIWENKYLMRIFGNTIEGGNVYDVINTDILPHLSFQKMPLNSSAATTPADPSTPQPSDSLQTPSPIPEGTALPSDASEE